METLAIFSGIIVAPMFLMMLMLRIGPISRPGVQAPNQTRVHHVPLADFSPADTPTKADASSYPTLRVIDGIRGAGSEPFSCDANAAHLEHRACALVTDYWSDLAWVTGYLSAGQFEAVSQQLERERLDRMSDMRMLVVREHLPVLQNPERYVTLPGWHESTDRTAELGPHLSSENQVR